MKGQVGSPFELLDQNMTRTVCGVTEPLTSEATFQAVMSHQVLLFETHLPAHQLESALPAQVFELDTSQLTEHNLSVQVICALQPTRNYQCLTLGLSVTQEKALCEHKDGLSGKLKI